jgi:transcriptional regulator with XRE-family HTH domain
MHPKRVGARLRELREAANMMATDVCEALEIDRGAYSLYERGKRPVPEHVKVKLADFYGTTLDYVTLGRGSVEEIAALFERLQRDGVGGG